jgi:hypothetical protein
MRDRHIFSIPFYLRHPGKSILGLFCPSIVGIRIPLDFPDNFVIVHFVSLSSFPLGILPSQGFLIIQDIPSIGQIRLSYPVHNGRFPLVKGLGMALALNPSQSS